jgi:uncharacterized protein YacL (UPF0231 family)
MAKPRSDSKLAPYRDELFPRMQGGEGQASLRKWLLQEHGVSTSNAALSNAWQSWASEEFEHNVLASKGLASDVIKQITSGDLDTMEQATKAAIQQTAFDLAMRGTDHKIVVKYCDLLHKSRQLDFEIEKAMNTLKSAQDKALDLLFEDIQGNAEAEALFGKMRDVLSAANEEAVRG